MGHHVENVFTFPTNQRQLVESGLGRRRLALSIWFSMAWVSVASAKASSSLSMSVGSLIGGTLWWDAQCATPVAAMPGIDEAHDAGQEQAYGL
uniref:Uncharacterized protein n=1 Tax=Ditylenchus dipsaci TaxID=166011 RepID=A0A915DT72_9BILA